MLQKILILLLGIICSAPAIHDTAHASLVLHSQTDVEVSLIGFDGLAEKRIFKGELKVDSSSAIDTPYRGLALLSFPAGQRYPIIITNEDFTVRITTPVRPPGFVHSAEPVGWAELRDARQTLTPFILIYCNCSGHFFLA